MLTRDKMGRGHNEASDKCGNINETMIAITDLHTKTYVGKGAHMFLYVLSITFPQHGEQLQT